MYESSYGLSDRPFAAAPAARRYFPAAAIEAARQTLARCIDRAEGAGLLIGPAGSGKSILCQVLAEQFRGRFLVALLASGRLETRRALLQAILFELGLAYRGLDEGELRLSLIDHLTAQEANNAGLLLLVDEAHSLPLRLLEEIHQITNLVHNGQPRVRVVLAGSPVLEEHFGSAKLESFNQRIAARCYLQSFKHEETLGYVRHAISHVGGQPDQLFAADALDAIHRATDGVPRLINQLCDHALLLAFTAGVQRLTAAGIEEAWADLQQLPTPWNAAPGVDDRPADIIEFGSLDEPAVAARLSPDFESDREPDVAPRLRTVADDEENLFTGEPVQRIERIKDQLGAIDEQFQPAGTIGPEVELVFSNAEVNPFAEPFEVEEVIVDRFSAMVADPLIRAPIVHSAEGAELSSMLAPHARAKRQQDNPSDGGAKKGAIDPHSPPANSRGGSSVEPVNPAPIKNVPPAAMLPPIIAGIDHAFATMSIDSGPAIGGSESSNDNLPSDEPIEVIAWDEPPADDLSSGVLPIGRGWLRPSDDPVLPEEPRSDDFERWSVEVQPTIHMPRNPSVACEKMGTGSEPNAGNSGGEASREVPVPIFSHPRLDDPPEPNTEPSELNATDPDDLDLIVIEDDPIPPPPTPTPSGARRQEYRQLFARLRRG